MFLTFAKRVMKTEHLVGSKTNLFMKTKDIQPEDLAQGANPDSTKDPVNHNYHSDRFDGDISWSIVDQNTIRSHNIDGDGSSPDIDSSSNSFWGGIDRE